MGMHAHLLPGGRFQRLPPVPKPSLKQVGLGPWLVTTWVAQGSPGRHFYLQTLGSARRAGCWKATAGPMALQLFTLLVEPGCSYPRSEPTSLSDGFLSYVKSFKFVSLLP